jgi:hypothetical protein
MKHRQIVSFLSGLIAGLMCVALRFFGSPEIVIIGLTWGVGTLFFGSVIISILFTGASRYLPPGLFRYLLGLILCTLTYLGAVTAFFGVFGFSPTWTGLQRSDDMVQFGLDVWLGLIAAGLVGAIGITLFAALLKRKWSNALLLRLIIAGFLAISITFVANFPFHNYWSFLGVLLPLGNALFCSIVVNEVSQSRQLQQGLQSV